MDLTAVLARVIAENQIQIEHLRSEQQKRDSRINELIEDSGRQQGEIESLKADLATLTETEIPTS